MLDARFRNPRSAAARRPSPGTNTPARRAGWCRYCGPAGCPIRGRFSEVRLVSTSLAKLMVSPASTGLIQRNSRKPGDGPQTATFSPRAAASLAWRWPSATSSFMQTDADMPARRRQPAEQRLAALLLVEVKALRIELRGEFLDVVGGEGERAHLAPLRRSPCPRRNASAACSRRRRAGCTMIGELHLAQHLPGRVADHALEGHDAGLGTAAAKPWPPRHRHRA